MKKLARSRPTRRASTRWTKGSPTRCSANAMEGVWGSSPPKADDPLPESPTSPLPCQLEQRPVGLGLVEGSEPGRRPPLLVGQVTEGLLQATELDLKGPDGILVRAHGPSLRLARSSPRSRACNPVLSRNPACGAVQVRAGRRPGPATARSVAWCSASTWSAPDGSGLLTLGASSVQTDREGSRRIVRMINEMTRPRATTVTSSGSSSPVSGSAQDLWCGAPSTRDDRSTRGSHGTRPSRYAGA